MQKEAVSGGRCAMLVAWKASRTNIGDSLSRRVTGSTCRTTVVALLNLWDWGAK